MLRYPAGIALSCPRAPGGLAAWQMRTTGRRWHDACQERPELGPRIRNGGSRRSCQKSFGSAYRPSSAQHMRSKHVSCTPTKSRQGSRISLGVTSLPRAWGAGRRPRPTGRNHRTDCCSRWCQTCGTSTRGACRTRMPSSIPIAYRGSRPQGPLPIRRLLRPARRRLTRRCRMAS